MEFVLFEDSENVDVQHAYGEVTTEKAGYRLVALIKNNNVTFEYQDGIYYDDNIEWEECQPFDINPKDMDACEVDKLGTMIYDLKFAK